MASLNPGDLVKLLQNMNVGECSDGEEAMVLQVLSIIPTLAGSDFWPNQGFYLKVSDSSNATYVSLPQEHDELIFSDKLQLGQFIHVRNLEFGLPVPIAKGVKPIPGRHPCIGDPKDLIAMTNPQQTFGPQMFDKPSRMEKSIEVVKRTREKSRSLSASKIRSNNQSDRKDYNFHSVHSSPINCLSKKCDLESKASDISTELAKISLTCVDQDSDSDSSRSTFSSRRKAPRRSWDGSWSSLTRLKERSNPRATIKLESRPVARTQSTDIAHSHYVHNDCRISEDDSSSIMSMRKREVEQSSKGMAGSMRQMLNVVNKTSQDTSYVSVPSSLLYGTCNDRKWIEHCVSSNSLPSNLVDLGKEVLKQRDMAVLAAVEALQEAAAAERLITCLCVYSELLSNKEDDPQPVVDRFLDLHDDIMQVEVIVQSLGKINELRTSNYDSISARSILETIKVASERKKRAASWIKAAVASDLSPFPSPAKSITESTKLSTMKKKVVKKASRKPTGPIFISKQRECGKIHSSQDTAKENLECVKDGSPLAVVDLASSLQREGRRWFLGFVERYLDDVKRKTNYTASESQIAAVLCQIKRVEEWIGVITRKDGSLQTHQFTLPEDEEIQACFAVRKKIYRILLEHVESAAHALETMSVAPSEDF